MGTGGQVPHSTCGLSAVNVCSMQWQLYKQWLGGDWTRSTCSFNKICPEPRADGSRIGVGEPSEDLMGMAHY